MIEQASVLRCTCAAAVLAATCSAQISGARARSARVIESYLGNAGIRRSQSMTLQAPPPSGGSLEIRVRWRAYPSGNAQPGNAQPFIEANAPPPAGVFAVTRVRSTDREVQLPRSAALSEDHLVAALVGPDLELNGWTLLPDPLLLRSEHGRPDAVLEKRILRRSTVEFDVDIPGSDGSVELRFYRPRWNGMLWSLELVGVANLRR